MSNKPRPSTLASLLDWADHRTGYRNSMQEALYERIPSGARWRYVFGSTLVFAFATQVITGLFLWMAYSPSSQTAWESVYYIQYQMQGGWLLRGVHHFMAQAMIVLLALHLLQVIIDGAYKAPREVNFWLGLVLMQIVLGLSLTGYLLPWDQKGYWATNVATNLMTLVPFGDYLQKLVVGGDQYGHHTLTRFFALHAGVLPALLVAFLGLHITLFRKHGITAIESPRRLDGYFWPDQILKDAVACLAVLAVVFLLAIHFDVRSLLQGELSAHHHGAELGAPADPATEYDARPEWYFLFLFQLLKYFPGKLEIVGAIILPGIVMFVLFIMPLTARLKFGHRFNVAFILLAMAGAVGLTTLALREDYFSEHSDSYLAAVAAAEVNKERVIELIEHRTAEDAPPNFIPREGAASLLRRDPKTQGPKLFDRNCSSCHSHSELDRAKANLNPDYLASQEISAPNLDGFATRQWIAGLLDPAQIDSPQYFGNTAHKNGRMVQWVKANMDRWIRHAEAAPTLINQTDEKIQEVLDGLKIADAIEVDALKDALDKLEEPGNQQTVSAEGVRLTATLLEQVDEDDKPVKKIQLTAYAQEFDDIVVALSAQAELPEQAEMDYTATADGQVERGLALIRTTCATGCHKIGDTGQLGLAPDLTGYGSWEWLLGMIGHPHHERFYRNENDRMPNFAHDVESPEKNQLSAHQVSMLADWLRHDYIDTTTEFVGHAHSPSEANSAMARVWLTEAPSHRLVGDSAPAEETELAQAERLFKQNCAACHSHTNEHGVGIVAENPSAPNLYRFASREWLTGLLDPEQITSAEYFGNTAHADGYMVEFVEGDVPELDEEGQTALANVVIALSAEAALPYQAELDKAAEADGTLEKGRTAIAETFENYACTDCHLYRDEGVEDAPTLTGYGSMLWLKEFISNPADSKFYGKSNDRMPAFAGHKDGPGSLLSEAEILLLSRFIRGM